MADKLVVAILGATGVVGTQMIQCLEERDFPFPWSGSCRLRAPAPPARP